MTKYELNVKQLKILKTELTRFMMSYKFALQELNTKIDILKQEFQYIHDYNPIEHVSSRVKSPESIVNKIQRRGNDFTLESIRENVRDIAGIRITCSFESDIYTLSEQLMQQHDISVVETKDYIKNPKPNGYRSLHLILSIPIFMSDRVQDVYVEVQIRTIAMDFWASLEHKIYYKYNKNVPEHLLKELKDAAESAALLDQKMEKIQHEMSAWKDRQTDEDERYELIIDNETFSLPNESILVNLMPPSSLRD
ncbi:GTP pyrophosphokinase family protein [Halalkalibacterium halodurans]|uniref:BH1885 protein n=1 Tax=Halalkalibacterium halodurans (strain ATCC BAA-125 / DSM 18197 / FERM 7344 / JCM 9153 / C-125) TaxID=272558 RepID=Q9KBP0_HALH5|nr:GTP pyrophosphokinase family protein [Halalkalibacterium halodurans]MDY7222444.1 GTP pyrophosphokinase family protein [Halalkalibacterium halodurans]MDY7241665.1 GTP pyrophosphokinase family protein [Halalkalibacterium halodurans]MED4082248.1 GTP pyrophosphokinase family protein [Halalkalibacterium halodurans]MED4083601.1 GTP pyrophosphokinase family protein [Halalkalibacterium halodurans]MED4105914.1 GTP pyrophosphokinase family protein [Halalkalibacterium halodurans]